MSQSHVCTKKSCNDPYLGNLGKVIALDAVENWVQTTEVSSPTGPCGTTLVLATTLYGTTSSESRLLYSRPIPLSQGLSLRACSQASRWSARLWQDHRKESAHALVLEKMAPFWKVRHIKLQEHQ